MKPAKGYSREDHTRKPEGEPVKAARLSDIALPNMETLFEAVRPALLRGDYFQEGQIGEGFFRACVVSCSEGSSTGSSKCSVRIEEFYADIAKGRKCAAEYRAEEEIGLAGADNAWFDAELFHYVNTVAEGVCDAFLGGSKDVCVGVANEIEVDELRADASIAQHTLSSIAERKDNETVGADRDILREEIHLIVGLIRGDIAMHPRVHYSGAVDAEEHS